LLACAFLGAGLAACGGRNDTNDRVDCIADGTCECRLVTDCPDGQHCRDGRCVTLQQDAAVPLLPFAARCQADDQCASGHCLPPGPGNGGVCTIECVPGELCPLSWDCKAAGAVRLCVPRIDRLCQVCTADQDCNAAGDLCLDVGSARACGRDCSQADCRPGYACADVPGADGGLRGRQCVPVGGTCDCRADSVGLTRACTNANAYGTCYGHESCRADRTWSACDARTAAPEVCDGLDNDCNDLTDAADPGLDVSQLEGYPSCRLGAGGACVGTWGCAATDGGVGWTCNAQAPEPETCNGRDDDCDGVVDNGFVDADGRYVDVHHCGACGADCEAVIPDLARGADGRVRPGAVACEVHDGAPACVPRQCAPGFFTYPAASPVLCQRAVSSQCHPCESDGDCFAPSDRCVPLAHDPHPACAQGCGLEAPYAGCTGAVGQRGCCPQGHTCEAVAGARLCVPATGTCACTAARAGATRPCFKSSATQTCLGLETCGAAGWSSCDTSVTAKEVCDYQDNDCDGHADEPFLNQHGTGTYDLDEHCGSCEANCLVMWSKAIQHAVGGCVYAGAPPRCAIVACTQESIAGGGACQRDPDCGAGRSCHPLYRQCVRSCASSAACGGNPCVDGYCTVACSSHAQCQATLGAPSTCQGGTCRVTYQFHDVDQDATNGCECPAALGAADAPDVYPTYPQAGWPYVDRDCDGVDGAAATSLFVAAGSAGGQGTRAHPFATIGAALAAWDPARHTAILVAAGSYPEQVILTNGVKLYGGYAPGFASRGVVTNPTIIEGPEPDFADPAMRPGTVNATGITQSTVLAGFIVRGYDVTYRPAAGGAGRSTYGIFVQDSTSQLVIANNRVAGGRGGDGAPGAPGAEGPNGGPGGPGLVARECSSMSCAGDAQPGGRGGANAACGTAGHTGAGSKGTQSPQDYQSGGLDGAGGYNGSYVADPDKPEKCKAVCQMPIPGMTGADAQAGPDGGNGSGGGGGDGVARIVDGEYATNGAQSGAAGGHGSGGGGGGAGGSVPNFTPADSTCTVLHLIGDLGASGGGGGAGGCGGRGGQAGGSGGGSFGIFVVFSSTPTSRPVIRGNHVDTGMGGFGQSGGTGGQGGAGGLGGANGLSTSDTWCAGEGGRGGRGGDGGSGGGGGGGGGGPAYGIAGTFLATSGYQQDNGFGPLPAGAAGAPGAGGFSPAGADCGPGGACDGAEGAPGQAATFQDLGGAP
jgi:hypothetical protein